MYDAVYPLHPPEPVIVPPANFAVIVVPGIRLANASTVRIAVAS